MRMISLFLSFCAVFFACDDNSNPMDSNNNQMEEETPPVVVNDTIRFASYNVSMYENSGGVLLDKLQNGDQHLKFRKLAAVIKKVRPDVLVLMELDYDASGQVLNLFNDKLLGVDLDGFEAIDYPYTYQIATNTGVLSEVDIDGNGQISLPNDAYGFGNYEGQYASAILSKYPINVPDKRSYQTLLWKDMPNASLPKNSDGSSYYSDEVLDVFRLSSKNHIDLPIMINEEKTVHALISHPTPPVFDGAEDRNGKRNHDEIKLWADYISGADYFVDDAGKMGALDQEESFIVFGDLNADPLDGDSFQSAINQLLDHERINQSVSNGALIPSSKGGEEHNQQAGNQGDPSYDTAFFGLRIDYVLPSSDLEAIDSGVFWPASTEEGHELIEDGDASDHLMVWVDLKF